MKQSEIIPKRGLLQWINAQKFVILGSLYVLFNIFVLYGYIVNEIDFQTEEFHPSPESMSGAFLWVICAPVSLVIYFFYAMCVKENPKPAKYFLILPGILWLVTLILFTIYQQSYYHNLQYYFTIHLIVGGISYLYVRLPKK